MKILGNLIVENLPIFVVAAVDIVLIVMRVIAIIFALIAVVTIPA